MLLEIENLKVHYRTTAGVVKAVDGVSLTIDENQVQGIAGESGCGKTTLIKSLLRLLPATATVTADKLLFKGRDLLAMPDPKFRRDILWQEISLVPQSAMNSLDPVYKVGDQVIEAIQAHSSQSRKQAAERTAHLFDVVGLQPNLMNSYPHEFSGGMRQRAMIAMSLALEPSLIIMDEPTTGLDVLVQERIIRKLLEIREQVKSSILLITHDISVIAEMSNRIGIMYAGRMMELGESVDLFENPYHPYTLGLKNAFPSIKALDKELISIPGSPPNLIGDLPGCTFCGRCPFAVPRCDSERPADTWINDRHRVACHRLDDVADIRAKAGEKDTWHSSKSAA
ncbi:MAG: ABC transporter ATP-binding protein [Hyphomicrobiales bacterium]|nr:ABC transporter ATP-binding protein [Hyphomicrobiales bacterium]MCP5372425.1 ABC transporter ATP-binding protein [Hyphomicrobiales bacterium]